MYSFNKSLIYLFYQLQYLEEYIKSVEKRVDLLDREIKRDRGEL